MSGLLKKSEVFKEGFLPQGACFDDGEPAAVLRGQGAKAAAKLVSQR